MWFKRFIILSLGVVLLFSQGATCHEREEKSELRAQSLEQEGQGVERDQRRKERPSNQRDGDQRERREFRGRGYDRDYRWDGYRDGYGNRAYGWRPAVPYDREDDESSNGPDSCDRNDDCNREFPYCYEDEKHGGSTCHRKPEGYCRNNGDCDSDAPFCYNFKKQGNRCHEESKDEQLDDEKEERTLGIIQGVIGALREQR